MEPQEKRTLLKQIIQSLRLAASVIDPKVHISFDERYNRIVATKDGSDEYLYLTIRGDRIACDTRSDDPFKLVDQPYWFVRDVNPENVESFTKIIDLMAKAVTWQLHSSTTQPRKKSK